MPCPDGRIDRRAVVTRHAVEVTGIDPGSALSVGNGELCMTVDVTGLQTFPERYPVGTGTLLATQSQWGWHSTPRPAGAELSRNLRSYRTSRGEVSYVDSPAMTGADDAVAVRIEAAPGVFGVRLAFPYGSTVWHDAADWSRPDAHETDVEPVPG